MSDIAVVFVVLGVIVMLFVGNWLPVELVAIGGSLALAATGVLTVEQSLAGFGDTTVIFIAALFVVSEGIDSSGITTWAGQELIARAGASRTRLLTFTMLLVALLTAVISVNGAVAALLPMVVVVALRLGEHQSQLLMPLAFGAHAGALLALTGTPVHILVSDAATDAGAGGFSYFGFALIGIPAVAGAIAIVVFFGSRLLPSRNPATMPPDLSDHARTLIDQYALGQWVSRLHVRAAQRSSVHACRISIAPRTRSSPYSRRVREAACALVTPRSMPVTSSSCEGRQRPSTSSRHGTTSGPQAARTTRPRSSTGGSVRPRSSSRLAPRSSGPRCTRAW